MSFKLRARIGISRRLQRKQPVKVCRMERRVEPLSHQYDIPYQGTRYRIERLPKGALC